MNVIDAAVESGVEKVIALSSVKASTPISLYGATKLVADKLCGVANVNARKSYTTLLSSVMEISGEQWYPFSKL